MEAGDGASRDFERPVQVSYAGARPTGIYPMRLCFDE